MPSRGIQKAQSSETAPKTAKPIYQYDQDVGLSLDDSAPLFSSRLEVRSFFSGLRSNVDKSPDRDETDEHTDCEKHPAQPLFSSPLEVRSFFSGLRNAVYESEPSSRQSQNLTPISHSAISSRDKEFPKSTSVHGCSSGRVQNEDEDCIILFSRPVHNNTVMNASSLSPPGVTTPPPIEKEPWEIERDERRAMARARVEETARKALSKKRQRSPTPSPPPSEKEWWELRDERRAKAHARVEEVAQRRYGES
ncbi:hypothetical protein HD806DRAFT_484043 [Xylariaceae sp. AK1471]|nr:hypothetical protein HD806DRAFT_484043 [Xylariaceae sp. AK1471]